MIGNPCKQTVTVRTQVSSARKVIRLLTGQGLLVTDLNHDSQFLNASYAHDPVAVN